MLTNVRISLAVRQNERPLWHARIVSKHSFQCRQVGLIGFRVVDQASKLIACKLISDGLECRLMESDR